MRLAEATWPEVPPRAVLLVPVGSCEQHGPHLPLSTDTLIATAVAARAQEQQPSLVLAPAITIGASGEHAGFPGTLSIGTEVLTTVLVELVRSADHFAGVVLVNGHGGNAAAVRRAAEFSAQEGRRVLAWWPTIPGGDAHAGHSETSLMLAIAPDLVRMPYIAGNATPIAELLPELRRGGVRAVSPNGVLGDPTTASPEHGTTLLDDLTADLLARIDAWHP